jgi:hypothetical protein
LPLLMVPTVAADAVERVSLLNALRGNDIGVNAARARTAAMIKFGILCVALCYGGCWELRPA